MALVFTDSSKPYFAKPLALKNLLGETAYNDLKKLLDPCCGIGLDKICTAPCGGGPASPLNSIQYNNGGVFYGDYLFLRDPITKETVITRVPTLGTDAGFVVNKNLPFISSLLSQPVEGSELYWQDTVSGYGSSIVTASLDGTSPSSSMVAGNTITGNVASIAVLLDDVTTQRWVFNGNASNTISNKAAQVGALADNTTARAEIEAENITTSEKSKVAVFPEEASIRYESGLGSFNTLKVSANGHQIKIDLGTLNITGIVGIPSYADDAAAVVGGLVTGDLYKTTTAGSTFLKIVP